jgi:hypothetical protein
MTIQFRENRGSLYAKFLSMEVMRQLTEQIPGAMSMAARCMGLTIPMLRKRLELRVIPLAYFIPLFKKAIAEQLPPELQQDALETFWVTIYNSLVGFVENPEEYLDSF